MKIVLGLIAAPIVLVVLGFVGTELNKAWWDRKVRILCETEGGVTVYETVRLTEGEAAMLRDISGNIRVPYENSSIAARHNYLTRWTITSINRRNPEVIKNEFSIYRRDDGKEFGKFITFSRIGGDLPTGISAPSSSNCQGVAGFRSDFINQIITVEGE